VLWAEPSSRFTALFEAPAIEWLKAASQKAVAELFKLMWDEIHGIMERAVKRGSERRKTELVDQIGVDEKAFRKGHGYLTLVNDLIRGRVLYVAEDRKQRSLAGFWETLTGEQISGIEAVAMDIWDPYIASVREHVPAADGKIVFDKLHVAQHLGDAVDRSRLQPMIEVARMLKQRFENIITYLRHRTTNATSESIIPKATPLNQIRAAIPSRRGAVPLRANC